MANIDWKKIRQKYKEKGLDDHTLTGIIEGLKIEMSSVENYKPDELEKALQYLLLTSSEDSRCLITVQTEQTSPRSDSMFVISTQALDQASETFNESMRSCCNGVHCDPVTCFACGYLMGNCSCPGGGGGGDNDIAGAICLCVVCGVAVFGAASVNCCLDAGICNTSESTCVQATKVAGTYAVGAGAGTLFGVLEGPHAVTAGLSLVTGTAAYYAALIGLSMLVGLGVSALLKVGASLVQCHAPSSTAATFQRLDEGYQASSSHDPETLEDRMHTQISEYVQIIKPSPELLTALETVKQFLQGKWLPEGQNRQVAIDLAHEVIELYVAQLQNTVRQEQVIDVGDEDPRENSDPRRAQAGYYHL